MISAIIHLPLLGPIRHRFAGELQSNNRLHITGFLRVIYAILNASVIFERNEKCLERNEKRLERNETRLARNETRGGNLLLGGTVERPLLMPLGNHNVHDDD